MTRITLRARLLGGAVLGVGLSVLMPTHAMAACVAGPDLLCTGNTTTTDVVGSRFFGMGNFDDLVAAGAVVDGFGLAISGNGTFIYTFTNDGTIQVNPGNTPTAGGGDGALFLSGDNSTITYSGSGDISNLGTGDGLEVLITGNGSFTGTSGGNLSATSAGSVGARLTTNGTGGINFTSTGTISAGAGVDSRAVEASVTSATGGDITLVLNNLTNGNTGNFNVLATSASDAGDISVSTGGTTTGFGVSATLTSSTATGNIGLTNTGTTSGRLVATNNGSGAVSVVNNGAMTSSAGISARNTNVGTTALVSVTGSGPITTSAGDGIFASNAGTGGTTVNYTGAINATGGDGIDASSVSGALTVTTNAVSATGGSGVRTNSTTGNQVITLNGPVTSDQNGVIAAATTGSILVNVNNSVTSTGVGLQLNGGSGPVTVNVANGASINSTGSFDVIINGTGLATVNNSGTIGADATGIAIGNNTFATPNDINNLTGGVINGRLDLGDLADTFDNAGTWNTSGQSWFYSGDDVVTNLSGGLINLDGATIDFGGGADTFANNAGGTININGATTLSNLETLTQNGTLNLNTFVLTGPAIAFVNGTSGVVDTNGSAGLAGFTSVTNSGTFDLAAGTFTAPAGVFTNNGRLVADEGVSSLTGQTSFVLGAAGVIDLQDGATGDQLTIASAYTGGGSLQVDVSQTAADRLILTGAISGVTAVDLNVVGTTFLGINQLVVDATNASTDAFVTGNITGTLNPLLTYGIVQDGNDYFVAAAPNVAAFEPLAVSNLAADFWYQSGYEVMAQTRIPVITEGFGVWGQIYGSIEKSGETDAQLINGETYDADNKLDTDRYGIQAGVDFGFAGARVGLTGGWGRAESKTGGANYKIDGWNIGLYGQVGGELGFHGEALVKYDRFDVDFEDGFFAGNDTDGHSWGGDLALGYRFQAGLVPILDVNVGLSHVRTKVDGITDFGFAYDYDTITSTRARGGVRAYFGGGWRPYLDLSAHHEFDGDGSVALFDGANVYDLRSSGKGTWFRLEGGLAGQPNKGPMLAAWAEAGDRKGAGIRLGFRFGGAAREVLPPPPPPMVEPVAPPPPPPATQTCADGTVILATEACPPPPPPPPPAAEPERG